MSKTFLATASISFAMLLSGCMFNPAGPNLEQRAITKAAELRARAAATQNNHASMHQAR